MANPKDLQEQINFLKAKLEAGATAQAAMLAVLLKMMVKNPRDLLPNFERWLLSPWRLENPLQPRR